MKAFFIMIFVLTICQSCITPKSTIYLQADSYPMNVKSSIPFEPTIKCDNVLNILVSPLVFNMEVMNKLQFQAFFAIQVLTCS